MANTPVQAQTRNTEIAATEENKFTASQWKLMWWRFCKNKAALVSLVVLIFLYLSAIFAPFIAPYDVEHKNSAYKEVGPMKLHFVDHNGKFHLLPVVYAKKSTLDPETFQRIYVDDHEKMAGLRFFVKGFEYKLFGLIPTNIHLFGTTAEKIPYFVFGTDDLGRDMFGRLFYGGQISLSIGLFGIAISFFLGVLIGGLAGYYGGAVDNVTQRIIEILVCIPGLPLWMGLSAALPPNWAPLKIYFGITIILSLLGWTGLARVVRGKFLSMRNLDFVVAARLAGRSQFHIIFKHMLPSFTSHIIASVTMAIPGMILGETALSFLGIGLKAPVISWGVLLEKAQNVYTLAVAPWLLIPAFMVIITVLAFNFVGDGLRDAADPYLN